MAGAASRSGRGVSELSVVSVVHNTRDAALRMLSSLEADPDHGEWEIVIVDN